MCDSVKNPAHREYRRTCQLVAGVSFLVYIGSSQAALRLHNAALSLPLAAVAGAALVAELVSLGMLIMRLRDEFQRVLLTRSFLWGTLTTMAFATIWGIVEMDGRGVVPHLDVIWIPMILICITAAAKLLIFRQHSVGNE